MYVLIITNGYPTMAYPGNGIFEFDQAKALQVAGCKVIFAGVDLRSIRRWRKWGFEHLFKGGVEIYALNIPVGRVPHTLLSYIGKWGIQRLYKKIKKEHGEPDIIHAHFLGMGEITLALREMAKSSKLVLTEHTSVLNDTLDRIPTWMKYSAKHIYSQFDKVIAVSPQLSDNINRFFAANSMPVPNMIDGVFLNANVRRRKKTGSESFKFIFVGNLIDRKQPVLCIESFYKAFKGSGFKDISGRSICLNIIGDGPERKKCIETIDKLELRNNVFMLGRLERKFIAKKMQECDCFVLPTKLETFGVVYIEAMACGLPVIATRCGGPESFVDESNGILIPVDDEPALVSAFKNMLENADNFDSEMIAKTAASNFSPCAVSQKIINVYENLLR